ncbi:stage III sporulation protein AE [Sporolactobacillus laevolacticus]|uniref:Stage III sporulation protein AE n=1 Tax=Sporolactobacillus laevolacticus DSM 442 TaxID=1395513 RepID=V6IVC6_9BACL|nr:stage III sporulation protein AE [Sporolactobacillus laevolacticus]EST11060.1 stage III sporulation protein AE [Sporolactobacillus laevolacticus DSM 442]
MADSLISQRFRILMFAIFAALLILSADKPAMAAEPKSTVDQWSDKQLDKIDTDQIEAYWNKVVTDYKGFLPETQPDFKSFVHSNKQGFFKKLINGLLHYFLNELVVSSKLLGTLILLTVFSTLLQTIQSAFEHKAVSKVAYIVVTLVLMILLLNSFRLAINYTNDTVSAMSHFLIALIPLIFALTAATGGMASVAFFHPLVIFLVNASGWLISSFVLPLLLMSALLAIVSTLSDHYKLTRLSELMKNVALFTLAGFFAIFLGVISVQGAATSISDGLMVKSAKFFTGNFIPVVGRMFTEAADTVMGASVLLKNTIGIAGLLILICITLFPLLKILSLAFIYNLAAAILQPLGSGPVIDCLVIMAKSIFYLFASLAVVSLMFFLALTIIIASGNLSLMVR